MGRHLVDGGHLSAWAAREMRPDPFSLPAHIVFPQPDTAAGPQPPRTAIVARGGVDLGEADGPGHVALADYMGVSVTVAQSCAQSCVRSGGHDGPIAAMVILDHDDPDLRVPLFVAHDTAEVTARWQSWARALGLPLLVRGLDGGRRAPFDMLGALAVKRPAPRRAGICLSRRHSPATMRRAPARPAGDGLRAGREMASWE